jgi:hypothetical protein
MPSPERPVPLLVDDLLALGDREGGGVILRRVGLGTDEAVLLGNVGLVLLAAPIKKSRRVGITPPQRRQIAEALS